MFEGYVWLCCSWFKQSKHLSLSSLTHIHMPPQCSTGLLHGSAAPPVIARWGTAEDALTLFEHVDVMQTGCITLEDLMESIKSLTSKARGKNNNKKHMSDDRSDMGHLGLRSGQVA